MLARLLMTALFFSFGSPAAAPAAQAATEHAPLFEAAAQEVDVPPELTQAIARVESGGTPYALNIEGRGYFFDSKEEALAAASEAQAAGQSFDSGIMQVNNWWLKRYGIPLEAVFDPAANILLGSWILKQELDRHGDTWKAVARYHSPNADRGQRYAALVRQALEKGPVQTTATPARKSRLSSLMDSKKEQSTRSATPELGQGSTAALVVYRGAAKPVFTRVPASAPPAPEVEQAVVREQSNPPSGQLSQGDLLADNNQEHTMSNGRVFVRRFQ